MSWRIREAEESDIFFIYSSWIKSYRHESGLAVKGCSNKIYYPNYSRVIDYILDKDDTNVIVSCHLEYKETVFGYMVYEPGIIHYCYVKDIFRKNGIARSLWEKARQPEICSHMTNDSISVFRKNKNNQFLRYNPFVLFHQKIGEKEDGRETKDASEITSTGIPS